MRPDRMNSPLFSLPIYMSLTNILTILTNSLPMVLTVPPFLKCNLVLKVESRHLMTN